jgi:L-amino acid ligase C-terminal domain 2
MKLLALEASQNSNYYLSRYQQIADFGADLYVLNGIGTDDFWPADRYRRAGTKHVSDLIEHAAAWHAEVGFDGVLTFSESAVIATAAVAEALVWDEEVYLGSIVDRVTVEGDSGTVESVDVPPEVSGAEKLLHLKITAKPGDVIRRPPEGNSIVGMLGATGSSLDDARQNATDLAGKIAVKLADAR